VRSVRFGSVFRKLVSDIFIGFRTPLIKLLMGLFTAQCINDTVPTVRVSWSFSRTAYMWTQAYIDLTKIYMKIEIPTNIRINLISPETTVHSPC